MIEFTSGARQPLPTDLVDTTITLGGVTRSSAEFVEQFGPWIPVRHWILTGAVVRMESNEVGIAWNSVRLNKEVSFIERDLGKKVYAGFAYSHDGLPVYIVAVGSTIVRQGVATRP